MTTAEVERTKARDGLATTPDRALALAAHVSTPRAGAAPAGAWSAREIVLHLVAVDAQVWQPRLDSLAGELEPHWSWIEPGLWSGAGDDTLEGALAAFRAARGATVARVDALGEDGWLRHGTHATYGRLDLLELLKVLADHDDEHLAQLAGFIRA